MIAGHHGSDVVVVVTVRMLLSIEVCTQQMAAGGKGAAGGNGWVTREVKIDRGEELGERFEIQTLDTNHISRKVEIPTD